MYPICIYIGLEVVPIYYYCVQLTKPSTPNLQNTGCNREARNRTKKNKKQNKPKPEINPELAKP